jgi:hypothetical protein
MLSFQIYPSINVLTKQIPIGNQLKRKSSLENTIVFLLHKKKLASLISVHVIIFAYIWI